MRHLRLFENFDKESTQKVNVAVYKWGKYLEDMEIDVKDLGDMAQLGEELSGFDVRPEDESKAFYAEERDIDDSNAEEEGYGVKLAYAVPAEMQQPSNEA